MDINLFSLIVKKLDDSDLDDFAYIYNGKILKRESIGTMN